MNSKSKPKSFKVQVNEFDGRTQSDLTTARFSGIRANDLANRFEIWILGQIDRTVSYQEFWTNEHSLTTAYCIAFGLKEATITGAVEDAIKEMRARKEGIEKLNLTDEGKRLLDQHGKVLQ